MTCFGRQCLGLLLAAVFAGRAEARIEELNLPEVMTAFGERLQLAACAQRETLWMEPYTVSIYLPDGRPLGTSLLRSESVPKIVRLDVTYEGSVPHDMPDGWSARLQRELSGEVYRAVQRVYSNLTSGDTVVFAYAPREGTLVRVNGRVVKQTNDARLVDALLSMFIGANPVSQNMKRLLLQGGC